MGEMAQELRALIDLLEDPSSVPSAYIQWLTAVCDSSSKDSHPLVWSPWAPTHIAHIYTPLFAFYTLKNKIKYF